MMDYFHSCKSEYTRSLIPPGHLYMESLLLSRPRVCPRSNGIVAFNFGWRMKVAPNALTNALPIHAIILFVCRPDSITQMTTESFP